MQLGGLCAECDRPRRVKRGPSFQDIWWIPGCWTQDEAGNHNTQESETFEGEFYMARAERA